MAACSCAIGIFTSFFSFLVISRRQAYRDRHRNLFTYAELEDGPFQLSLDELRTLCYEANDENFGIAVIMEAIRHDHDYAASPLTAPTSTTSTIKTITTRTTAITSTRTATYFCQHEMDGRNLVADVHVRTLPKLKRALRLWNENSAERALRRKKVAASGYRKRRPVQGSFVSSVKKCRHNLDCVVEAAPVDTCEQFTQCEPAAPSTPPQQIRTREDGTQFPAVNTYALQNAPGWYAFAYSTTTIATSSASNNTGAKCRCKTTTICNGD